MLFVEFLFDNPARKHFLTYLNVERRVEFGVLKIDECHANALVRRYGMVARGDYSHLFAILQYGISMAWNGLVIKFYANQFLGKALGFLLHECFLADKLGLVELAEHTESGHDRCYLVGQFIAIERQSHLKSQRVTAA